MAETISGGSPFPLRMIFGRFAAPLLSAALFLSVFFVPVLGGLFNPFAPLPLIYAYFRFGQTAAISGAFFSALVVAAASDPKTAVVYFLSYCLLGLVLARFVDHKAGLNKAVMASAGLAIATTGLFFVATSGIPLNEYFDRLYGFAQTVIAEMVATYKKAGIQDDQLEFLVKNTPLIAKWFVNLLPGLIVTAYLVFALCNYAAYKFVKSRWAFLQQAEDGEDLLKWSPPDMTVYLFIAGLASAMYPNESARFVGINLLIVSTTVYSVAGIYILQYWFEKIRFPKFLRMIVYLLILLQPFIAVAVAATGLFDLWFDFRKVRQPANIKEEDKWT